MASDFEDFYDIESLSDDELNALVREELEDQPDIDAAGLEVRVAEGKVTIGGRVGTEAEVQAIESLLTDVLGVPSLNNELVVDELRRIEQPEAADEANARVYATPRGQRGGADRTEDSAAHLLDDTGGEQFGTGDVREAIERGLSYNPPSTHVQEGTWNRESH